MKTNLKIYFAGSIRGADADRETYLKIIKELKKRYIVLTEHVGNGEMLKNEARLTDEEIESRDMKWIREADFVIAEVTSPSHGVGIEISEAKHLGKPVLCIYRINEGEIKKISAMIAGNNYFSVQPYNSVESILQFIEDFAGKIQGA